MSGCPVGRVLWPGPGGAGVRDELQAAAMRWRAAASFLPTDIRVVGIPQLMNRTTYFDVEQILTEKIRNEFIGRGKYRVVPDAAGADAVLNAEIISITLSPIGLTTTQLASRYQFVLTMKLDFVDVAQSTNRSGRTTRSRSRVSTT